MDYNDVTIEMSIGTLQHVFIACSVSYPIFQGQELL